MGVFSMHLHSDRGHRQRGTDDILTGKRGRGGICHRLRPFGSEKWLDKTNCIVFDHQIVHPYPLTIAHQSTTAVPPFPPPPNVHLDTDLPVQLGYENTERASVWGPTCDSFDCVRQIVRLPQGLQVGDWLGWGEMGAYTMCAASRFNGFNKSPVHWTTGGDTPNARVVRAVLGSAQPDGR